MGAILSEYFGGSETARFKVGHSTPVHFPESTGPRTAGHRAWRAQHSSKSSCKAINQSTLQRCKQQVAI
jgi:hypothetical protein